ncbi:uncharacterized protein LOC132760255 [Ruditapes philippinarum]|uniref:uncharacterized protein LOC132760255 n=1 Tax=Ruditapes philippinarum TaxID=129788 RepID=UPI00295A7AD1|nr:uncharacterized protein LOC132760255 [Ruditapes philippinarum]
MESVSIWISTEFNNAHRLTLTYDLHLLSTHYDRSEVLLPNLKRQGLYCRHNDMFVFEIRFPVEGYFKLELFGGYHRSHSMKLCYFKLVCEKSLSNFRYLPYYTENLMWGPGPSCEEYGLVLPSKPTGIVIVDQEPKLSILSTTQSTKQPTYKPVYFVFDLHTDKSRDKVFTIKMYGYDPGLATELATPFDENGELVDKTKKKRKKGDIFPENNTDYTTYAECERDDLKKQLKITVQIPHEGEFVLVIKASSAVKDVDGKITAVNDAVDVCVYLLRTSDDPHRENVPQKLARKELIRSMQGTSSNVIKQAVDKCLKVKIDKNDGDIAAAQTKAEYLTYRKAVFDAIHRRNFRIINEELLKLSKYKHSGALASEIRMLFTLRKQLNMLIELTKHIPELQRAAADLVQIEEPSPEVHITMGALFLLLEEPDKYLDNWEFIVKQFKSDKKQGGESPIIRKMYLVAEMYPPKNTRRKINTLLTEYSFEQVKHVSTAAAKFHVWVQKVMAVLQDLEFDIEFPSNIEAADDNLEDENAKETTDAPETTDAQETTDVDTVQNFDNKSKEGDTKEDNILAEHDT